MPLVSRGSLFEQAGEFVIEGPPGEEFQIHGRRMFLRVVKHPAAQTTEFTVVDENDVVLRTLTVPQGHVGRFVFEHGVEFNVQEIGDGRNIRMYSTASSAGLSGPPPSGVSDKQPDPWLDPLQIEKIPMLSAEEARRLLDPPPSPPPQILFRIGPRGSGKTLSILQWIADDPEHRVALFASQHVMKHARELAARHKLADRLQWWNLMVADDRDAFRRALAGRGQKPPTIEVAIDDLDLVLPLLFRDLMPFTISRATVTGYFDEEGDKTWKEPQKTPLQNPLNRF